MKRSELVEQIKRKQSFLCVGLDTDINKIPEHLKRLEDPIFAFNKEIIDRTKEYCVSYKLNLAFYESMGLEGWKSLERTIEYIPSDLFTIADAKRGDIGNTADMYARAFFDQLNFDSITVAPYMGKDSVTPFLNHEGKWTIILGLTSNVGSADFQTKEMLSDSKKELYQQVIETSASWGNEDNTMFVVGATKAEYFQKIRQIVPEHFLLVPGVGAQGGSLQDVCEHGMNDDIGLLINSSRGIIYAGNGPEFGDEAAKSAEKLQMEMKEILTSRGLI